ncbi:glycosyltransferase [Zunongwangia sp. F260]|uniref:Glycosyltransferase n=1 Tax=Autumnicola lenta TaxID=3075593 RepID=A0ABU3CG27_9FLAO|nr:glycosyltransferase [Zunongwangia sp. F260]MDT0645305.1 glycosyltransferase [Zunongwangia sp. F260]
MEASILIVSRNRKEELSKTLDILRNYVDLNRNEISVFLDGCTDDSWMLKKIFPWVNWQSSETKLGASKARNILYKTAKGEVFFGFDDDAHPIQPNFIELSQALFAQKPTLGIIAFKEVKGVFDTDESIPKELLIERNDLYVKEFLGCGFAIKKEIYDKTRGFPVWIDIYGEEICVALETLEMGYDILFSHKVMVNHRINTELRKSEGSQYFRFGKQLKNTSFFYLVYYPFPLVFKKIGRLYFLNFKKYGLKDKYLFREYFFAMCQLIINMRKVLKHRRPVSRKTIEVFNSLPNPSY